ncbi:hypothetical protein [Streptomyces atratus]|uniref:hypothetical protein n=1 Tax=Streptomyces atratus TaxID=1893 RepID=UPI003647F1E8
MSGTYNGWTNWATWFVSSELENNTEWYRKMQALVRTEASEEEFARLAEECLFPSSSATTYGEMSRSEFGDVDWKDLRETLIND